MKTFEEACRKFTFRTEEEMRKTRGNLDRYSEILKQIAESDDVEALLHQAMQRMVRCWQENEDELVDEAHKTLMGLFAQGVMVGIEMEKPE